MPMPRMRKIPATPRAPDSTDDSHSVGESDGYDDRPTLDAMNQESVDTDDDAAVAIDGGDMDRRRDSCPGTRSCRGHGDNDDERHEAARWNANGRHHARLRTG